MVTEVAKWILAQGQVNDGIVLVLKKIFLSQGKKIHKELSFAFTVLKPNINIWKLYKTRYTLLKIVDPDQLALKPADQDPQFSLQQVTCNL